MAQVTGPFFVVTKIRDGLIASVIGIACLAVSAAVRADVTATRSEAETVADLSFRLAHAGAGRCPVKLHASGLTFQHLGQFALADRPAVLRERRLDLGPTVIAVARDSPAESGAVEAGDILLAVNGRPLPASATLSKPFSQSDARAYSDAIDTTVRDALAAGSAATLTLLRDDRTLSVSITGTPACPSRVHLAQSTQTNAFADGTHVFVTTGLLRTLRSADELAFVLAHEMAHNILGHAAQQRASGVPRDFTRVLGRNGKLLRAAEREADALGIALMRDAGYDPAAALAVLARTSSGPSIAFLSAHDSVPARRKRIREMIRQPVRVDPTVDPVRP